MTSPDRPRRLLAPAVALIFLSCAVGATPGSVDAPSPAFRDPGAMVTDLGSHSARLSKDTRRFLEATDRWEPVGLDEDLWREVQRFELQVDRVDRGWQTAPEEQRLRELRGILESGRSLERLLDRTRPDARVRRDWKRVRRELMWLAEAQGWDYAEGRFDASAAPGPARLAPQPAPPDANDAIPEQ